MPATFQVSEIAISPDRFEQRPTSATLALRGLGELEAHRATASSLIAGPQIHGLVLATHLAFAHHLPLVIAPDDVWACIAQGVAHHVASSGESLRKRLVRHDGQMEIRVRHDELRRGGDNDWTPVVDDLVEKMQQHLLAGSKLLLGNFSTTGPIERVASQIVLLSAMQKFFHYVVETRCGIPEVTLLGSVNDWKDIRLRAGLLRDLDLGWWIDPLLPVLDEFVRASSGNADAAIWKSFYKHESVSGGEFVSGWLLLLMPYIEQEAGNIVRNPLLSRTSKAPATLSSLVSGWLRSLRDLVYTFHLDSASGAPALSVSHLPPSTVTAPFVWEYLGETFAMDLGAGLVGATQDPGSGAVRAVHGWWVSHRASELLIAEHIDETTVRARPRRPERLRSLAGLPGHVPRGCRVELVLEGCKLLESLEIAENWSNVKRIVLRDNPALRSLDGLPQLWGLDELIVEGAPALHDVRALQEGFLKRVTFARCPLLADIRPLTRTTSLERVTIADCEALAGEFHGSFEGDAIPLLRSRIIEKLGRSRSTVGSSGRSSLLTQVPTVGLAATNMRGDAARRQAISPLLAIHLAEYLPWSRRGEHHRYMFLHDITLCVESDRLVLAGTAWPTENDRWDGPQQGGTMTHEAPFWVAEVFTRDDPPRKRAERLELLARAGVERVWHIDIDAEMLTALRRDSETWRTTGTWSGDVVVRAEPFEASEFALFDLWLDQP